MFAVNEGQIAFQNAGEEPAPVRFELLAFPVQPDQCLHVDSESSGDVRFVVFGSSHDGLSCC